MIIAGQEKIYCFSEGEFSILADACGIRSMLCFRVAGGSQLKMLSRAEYNKTVYGLCKRGILYRDEKELALIPELDEMISRCRQSGWVVCFNHNADHFCNACIYLSEDCFTLILPGSRKSEYIRIGEHGINEFDVIAESYLENSDEVRIFDGRSLQETAVIRKKSEENITLDELRRYLKQAF